ncbi:MAG: hypothetical protein A3E36_04820 [Candidatus Andersenbacteria bacterium RIFCSPHIGHO2_12_FULL_45_11b]|uniref:CARDB domain-containing protein n=1 Tax=Candidatus Andersenbacteria bacterium RIFCSPHIGHO2_12_FULL_45_11b TaxID=1797282 RepID=A0A1G1XE34_9BACT|nr:MAG: hypothetical protein A3E36_04820 [Candidatus Andersenbacteria bacterium RIFCSPHIGHO2_12_FULL_45_11b]
MSMHRVLKKTAYAVGYIAVAGLLLFIIIAPFIPKKQATGPVITPEPLAPIIVENIVAIPHIAEQGPTGKTVDVVARLRNNNPRAGVVKYPISFTLYDASGTAIQSKTQDEYVLPGSIQYVAALDIPVPPGAVFDHADITTPAQPAFIVIPGSAPTPQFSIFLRDRTYVSSGAFPLEQQTGIVTNTSSFDWQKVQVVAVAVDDNGKVVGVGKTFVGKLLIGEQREFTLQWPRPSGKTNRVIAIATTDMYSDSNFVQIVGDPNNLR